MPVYFFDCHNNGDCVRDSIGSELTSDCRARKEATSVLFEIMRSNGQLGRRDIQIHVRDSSGRVFYRARLTFEDTSTD